MMDPEISEAHALSVIDEAVELYSPSHVFAMFSGGHDSLTATRICSKHPRFSGAVHINTGIGIEATREFVRETCKREGWPLKEYRAKEDCNQDYDELVLERGFPGPPHHYKMYCRLKERALRLLIRTHKKKYRDRILLVTGCRQQESIRRMGHVEPIQQEGVKVWVAPIYNWGKADCNEYIDAEGLKPNEVVKLLHMSGECLCGAFAHPGELDEIRMWFPMDAARIDDLEKQAKAAGFDWGWESRPPRGRGKTKRDASGKVKEMMCTSCTSREDDHDDPT